MEPNRGGTRLGLYIGEPLIHNVRCNHVNVLVYRNNVMACEDDLYVLPEAKCQALLRLASGDRSSNSDARPNACMCSGFINHHQH